MGDIGRDDGDGAFCEYFSGLSLKLTQKAWRSLLILLLFLNHSGSPLVWEYQGKRLSLSFKLIANQVEFWLYVEGTEELVGGLERSFILRMTFRRGANLYFPIADFHGISSSFWLRL